MGDHGVDLRFCIEVVSGQEDAVIATHTAAPTQSGDAGDGPIDDCLSIRKGILFVEGCAATQLAERFGTPLYVMSEDQIRRNVRSFQAEFQRGWPDGQVVVMPSIKANYGLALRRILTEEGAGCDTFGAGELQAALSTGVPPDLISFNGSSKTQQILIRAVAAGVRITLDSAREVELVIAAAAAAGRTARVRLRVRPDFDIDARSDFFSGPVSVRTASQMYKPGIPSENLAGAARDLLAATGVELTGVMMHAGRHTTNLRVWSRIMQRFVEVIGWLRKATGGWEPHEIDIGGGFAVPRDPFGRSDRRRLKAAHAPSIAQYARTITRTLREELRRIGMSTAIRLEVEPGRSIYGNAGIHLASVTNIKHQTTPVDYTWIETDTSDSFLPDVNLERNRWSVYVAGRATDRPTMVADVVGISCNFDVIVPAANLPEVRVGDTLAFIDTGAYQDANATNFNALPRPATVLVTGKRSEIVKRAETIDDVFARDVIPPRLAGAPHTAQVSFGE
ncbi:MAG: alanine racemase [Candidatus Dormiibacterota bacterium]